MAMPTQDAQTAGHLCASTEQLPGAMAPPKDDAALAANGCAPPIVEETTGEESHSREAEPRSAGQKSPELHDVNARTAGETADPSLAVSRQLEKMFRPDKRLGRRTAHPRESWHFPPRIPPTGWRRKSRSAPRGLGVPGFYSDSDSTSDGSDLEAILSKIRESHRRENGNETATSSGNKDVDGAAWETLDLRVAAPWFLSRNVHTREQLQRDAPRAGLYRKASALNTAMPDTEPEILPYQLHRDIFDELSAMVVASLRSSLAWDTRVIIKCPADNGHFFLEAVVGLLARSLDAHLICLDAQDLADLNDIPQLSPRADLLESLPYVSYTSHHDRTTLSTGNVFLTSEFDMFDHVEKLFRVMFECVEEPAPERVDTRQAAADVPKSSIALDPPAENNNPRRTKEGPRLIAYVRDFRELLSTEAGRDVVVFLNEAVTQRREAGLQTVWIGGNCSSKNFYGPLGSGASWLDESQSVQVTPPGSAVQRAVLAADQPRWNLENNIRNLKRALRGRLQHEGSPAEPLAERLAPWDLGDKTKFRQLVSSLEAAIWPSEAVNAVAKCVCGRTPNTGPVALEDISNAVLVKESSREENQGAAPSYVAVEDAPRETPDAEDRESNADPDEVIKKVLGDIDEENSYLQCVKDGLVKPGLSHPVFPPARGSPHVPQRRTDQQGQPGKFNVHFDQVIVAPEIKEAAQRLVRLSIDGRKEYAYGVLRSHRVPGVLLYGPPGTGKTLMAKAMATEVASVTLEISGAQILQSKVGQSEKIIEAVFTAARGLAKHWPCVVFLDEADSILGRRTEKAYSWERSMVNQFLHEWDALVASTERTFVIVATNRPQDIDEAILRRLPQRLHIGLPDEHSRLVILKHYLLEEERDGDVNLGALAKATHLYSGSDLKNICVYAAMHATEEQMDKPSVTPPGLPKPKRVLRRKHFAKAMRDVRPCVSRAMLSDVHNFETKYGSDKVQRRSLGWIWGGGHIGSVFRRWISGAAA